MTERSRQYPKQATASATERTAVGVDMGGTWVRAAVVAADGRLIKEERCRTPDSAFAQEQAPLELASILLGPEVCAIGLGVAGIVRDGNLIRAGNLEVADFDFRGLISRKLKRPVVISNDAQAAAVAEARLGSGKGLGTIAYVSIGTGVGGAIVDGGKLLNGAGTGGEFGHMVLAPNGPRCKCGSNGCWEQLASGVSLGRIAARLAATNTIRMAESLSYSDTRWLGARALDAAATSGVPEARAAFREAATFTAVGLRNLAVAIDPEAIVVGGSVAAGSCLFWQYLQQEFEAVRASWCSTRLVKASLSHPGIIGAALLALEQPT